MFGVFDDRFVEDLIRGLAEFAPAYAALVEYRQFRDPAATRDLLWHEVFGDGRYPPLITQQDAEYMYALGLSPEYLTRRTGELASKLSRFMEARARIAAMRPSTFRDLVSQAMTEIGPDLSRYIYEYPSAFAGYAAGARPGDGAFPTPVEYLDAGRWAMTLSRALSAAGVDLPQYTAASGIALGTDCEAAILASDDGGETALAIEHQPVTPIAELVPSDETPVLRCYDHAD